MYAIMLGDSGVFFQLGSDPVDPVHKTGHGNRTPFIGEATLYNNLEDLRAQQAWISKRTTSYWAGRAVRILPNGAFEVLEQKYSPARLV